MYGMASGNKAQFFFVPLDLHILVALHFQHSTRQPQDLRHLIFAMPADAISPASR